MCDQPMLTHPPAALLLNLWTSFEKDCSCNSRPVFEILVSGIDDRIGRLGGDISLGNLQTLPGEKCMRLNSLLHTTSYRYGPILPQGMQNKKDQ